MTPTFQLSKVYHDTRQDVLLSKKVCILEFKNENQDAKSWPNEFRFRAKKNGELHRDDETYIQMQS